jgi:S1-C subfamily serine protease
MKRGFIQAPILIAVILGVIVLGGVGYIGVKQYQGHITKGNTQSTTTPTLSEVEKPVKQEAVNPAPVKRTVLSNAEIIKKVKPATVYIETTKGAGSGMIIDANGYILTNAHVVWDVSAAKIKLSDGTSLSAEVIGRDEIVDLAILKIIGTSFSKVTFGNSDNVAQGDDVFTLGYPFGLEGDVSFKEGTISRRINDGNATYLETSAEIHPGNSGGPLVNKYGEVVGVNSASYGQSIEGVNVGETIKLAIPINVAKNLIPELKSGRKIVIDHVQYESGSSGGGGGDASTTFAIKTQCTALGQAKKDKEDFDFQNGSIQSGGTVAYGYSPKLNTCIYGRLYVIYHFNEFGREITKPLLHSLKMIDLLTGSEIYSEGPLYWHNTNEDVTLIEERSKVFWVYYDSLVE